MVRGRDSKGRYISVDKTPRNIFRPQQVLHINYVDRYIGTTSRKGKAITYWQPKDLQSTTTVEELQAEEPLLQEEIEQHINPAGD